MSQLQANYRTLIDSYLTSKFEVKIQHLLGIRQDKFTRKPLSQVIDRDQVEAQTHMHTTNYTATRRRCQSDY